MRYFGFALGHAGEGTAHTDALDELLAVVELADAVGLDGWFFPEHHGSGQHSLSTSPHLLIAAASRRTTRIRLGTMVDLLPFHHPLRVAEEIRLLDLLTKGRLEIGVGAGGFNEHAYWGIAGADAPEMLEAALTLVRCFLNGSGSDYRTRWWSGSAPDLAPEGVQHPHPPLWLATVRDESIETAARWGMNCQLGQSAMDMLPARIARYREAWADAHPATAPGRVAALVDLVVAEDGDEARRTGQEFHRRKLDRLHRLFAARPNGFVRSRERQNRDEGIEQLSYPELIDRGLVVCGDVQDCVDQLVRLAASGADTVTLWMPVGDADPGFLRRSLQLFCHEVAPRVASAVDGPR